MQSIAVSGSDKATRYQELLPQLAALFEGEPDRIANLANELAAFDEADAAGLAPVAELLGTLSW